MLQGIITSKVITVKLRKPQSSQVDLLAKSEMLDGVVVIFDAEGVTR